MLFDSVYPTRPSDTVTKYTIYPPILFVERLLKWSWVLLCYFIATLLYHQKWSTNLFFSYYLVVATAKMSLDFYFLICKSQDCAINCQWIIQSKLIDRPSDILFNFGIAPALVVLLGWPAGLNASWRYNTYLFPILRQNKQQAIRNSCRSNLWPTTILILSYIEFKILRKRPGDEAFQVSFKFPRRG